MKPQGSARIAIPIALGLVAALMFLSLIKSVPHAALLGFMAPMPLMVAALGLGQISTGVSGLVGAVACGMVAGLPFGVSFLGIAGMPALLVANRASRHTIGPDETVQWYTAGRVLAWLAVASAVTLLIWVWALPDHEGGLRGWLEEFLSQALDMLGDQVDPKERQDLTRLLSSTLPAIITGVWMMMAVVNAMTAQFVLTRFGQALRPDPDYLGLELPWWLVLLPAGATLVWALASETVAYIAANVVVVGLMPFSALGVAMIHRWLAKRQTNAVLGLFAFYGTLILFSVWALIPLAVLGLARFVRFLIIRHSAERTEG